MSKIDEPSFDRVTELLADQAIVGLTPEEADELAQLGDESQSEALALEIAAARISVALSQLEPEELSSSLQSRLEAMTGYVSGLTEKREPRRSIVGRVIPWLGWAAAAAFVLISGPGFFRDSRPAPPVDPLAGVKRLSLSATEHPLARGARGSLAWNGDWQQGELAIDGLAEVDPDRGIYQLWIFDATRDDRYPVDGGTFAIRDSGKTTRIPIHAALKVGKPTFFAITLEPAGGVVVSDRKRIVLTASP